VAKIPRINKGDRPSAVGSSGYHSPAAVAAPIAALGEAGDAALQGELRRLEKAQAEKQMIVDEVEGSKRLADFDATIREGMDTVKKDFFNDPDKAVSAFTESAQAWAGGEVKAASEYNGRVGLTVAQGTSARIAAATREMYAWVSDRQTQRAKGNTEEIINRTAAGAEHLTSAAELDRYITRAKGQYQQQLTNVFGAADAETRMADLATKATQGFFAVAGDRNPIGVLSALDDPNGPAAKYLTPAERDSLRKQTRASLDGRQATREIDLARQASGENAQALALLDSGKLQPELMISLQNRNREAQRAALIDPSFTKEQREKQIIQLKRQEEALDAIEDMRRRGTRFDPTEQVTGDSAMLAQHKKEFKKLKGQPADLMVLEEHLQRIILARRKREISDPMFVSMKGDIDLALEKSVKAERNNDGFLFFVDSREAGNIELNRLFSGRLKTATEAQQTAAWREYMRRFAAASKGGVDVKSAASRAMAREAASMQTGVFVGAAD